MRIAERPALHQPALVERAGQRMDHRHFERLGRRQWRQQGRQARRQHRLARAGRADHQQIVAARCGDFERALGAFLALDVLQIDRRHRLLGHLRHRFGQQLRAFEMIDQRQQRGRRQHLGARPGRLAALRRRADQAALLLVGRHRRGQHAGHRRQPAIEAELAQRDEPGDLLARQHAHGDQQRHGDRQVEMAALLGDVGRRQVDGDAPGRQRQAERVEGGADPLAAFADRLVGQADHGEGDQAAGHLRLHLDGQNLDALEGDSGDASDHGIGGTDSAIGFALYRLGWRSASNGLGGRAHEVSRIAALTMARSLLQSPGSYVRHDLDLSKTKKTIRCETSTRGA